MVVPVAKHSDKIDEKLVTALAKDPTRDALHRKLAGIVFRKRPGLQSTFGIDDVITELKRLHPASSGGESVLLPTLAIIGAGILSGFMAYGRGVLDNSQHLAGFEGLAFWLLIGVLIPRVIEHSARWLGSFILPHRHYYSYLARHA